MTAFTMSELNIGQSASFSKTITEKEVALFAEITGDVNPVHMDAAYAEKTIFKGRIAHGMLCGSLLSTVFAMQMPGPGSIYLKQELKFTAPVRLGDTLTATAVVKEKKEEKNIALFDCTVVNQDGVIVIEGQASLMPPKNKE